MLRYKSMIAEQVAASLKEVGAEEIVQYLEYPPNPDLGDLALPCFKFSKLLRKSPQVIAEGLKNDLQGDMIDRVEVAGGYVNIFLDRAKMAQDIVSECLTQGNRFASQNVGDGKTIVIDYSSPNIAKPFHVGHLRSTVIGNALKKIFTYLGYKVVGVNHLGDWGTQFGKLIVAYQRWGDKTAIEEQGIDELLRLYVKFHEVAEGQPELEDEARGWFVRMEKGDEEALSLWRWFVDVSLKEFEKIYGLLGVSFEAYTGESFYNDRLAETIKLLHEKELLVEDQGAWIVRMDEYDMPPVLMLKQDGSSLYHTRDVAAAIYRKQHYNFDKVIYITDYAQNLHFRQWFKIIELLGFDWAKDLVHVAFGRVSLEGASLSTRKGNVVKLDEVLQQSIARIGEIIDQKNADLPNKDEVARQVGVGAVIFNDLSNNRIKDIVFSWEEALNFDGETGPYVQYTHARACSVLRKASGSDSIELPKEAVFDASLVQDAASQGLVRELHLFRERIEQAAAKLEPSVVTRYTVDLAQAFNRFYHDCPILIDDMALRTARLTLVKCVQNTLSIGLDLIGLQSPERI